MRAKVRDNDPLRRYRILLRLCDFLIVANVFMLAVIVALWVSTTSHNVAPRSYDEISNSPTFNKADRIAPPWQPNR